jgi:hypothetical protein
MRTGLGPSTLAHRELWIVGHHGSHRPSRHQTQCEARAPLMPGNPCWPRFVATTAINDNASERDVQSGGDISLAHGR